MTPPQTATTAAVPNAALASFKMPWTKTPIATVKVTSLKFLSDHHAMTDNNTDWTSSGSLFPKPEWTYGNASAPISHTKNRQISVELEIEVYPLDADEVDCDITGTAAFGSLVLKGSQKLKGGKFSGVYAKSTGNLPDSVQKLTGDIKWTISPSGQGALDAGSSWGHTVYATLDTPIVAPDVEGGFTLKRMDKAVQLVAAAGSNNAHTIVSNLMKLFGGYWLNDTPRAAYTGPVPTSDLDFPRYLTPSAKSKGGAWLISDFMDAWAECQAMVRFVRAVIKQVGCPGTANVMLVFSDPDVGGGNTVLEQDLEGPLIAGMKGYGLNDHDPKVINGLTCAPALTDAFAKEGYTFDALNTGAGWIGLNNFEACLKFTDSGSSKYYGGGAGITDTKEQMIFAFTALAWVADMPSPPGKQMHKIVKLIKQYRDAAGHVIP